MQQNPWDNNTEFEQQKRTPWWTSRVLLLIVLSVTVLVGLTIFWNLLVSHVDDVDESNIPVFRSDMQNMKERPQRVASDEGGSIYGLLSQEKSKNSSLKQEEEAPLHASSFEVLEETPSETSHIKAPEVIRMNSEKPAQKKEILEPLFFLQIASLTSHERAQKEGARLKKKYQVILGKLTFQTVQKEVSGKGTYYRIHVGPFEQRVQAEKICRALSQKGAACLLVK